MSIGATGQWEITTLINYKFIMIDSSEGDILIERSDVKYLIP